MEMAIFENENFAAANDLRTRRPRASTAEVDKRSKFCVATMPLKKCQTPSVRLHALVSS